jgi:hypothetical protein
LSLLFQVRRHVTYEQEQTAVSKEQLLVGELMGAYYSLRAGVAKGDITITLSIEGNPEEIGAVFEDETPEQRKARFQR